MKYQPCSFAVRVIAAAAAAVQSGQLTDVDMKTIGMIAAQLCDHPPQQQIEMLRELAKQLGIGTDGGGNDETARTRSRAVGRRDPNRANATRAQIVAQSGEMDSEDRRVLARVFGQRIDDGHGDYDEKGMRVLADGRIQLTCLRTRVPVAEVEEE